VECFVYGRALAAKESGPETFPARQTLEASQTVARLHGLHRPVFIRQHPAAIDAGAFHNDVLAVAHQNVLLFHEQAWANGAAVIEAVGAALRETGGVLVAIEIEARQFSLTDAVRSYLFNSQIVSLPDGSMLLLAPADCRIATLAHRVLDALPAMGTPIRSVRYVDVRQSMRNGGGPACLRLRVLLNDRELAATHPGVFLTARLYDELTAWVNRHYRDRLTTAELTDPQLLEESRRALDELSGVLNLGSIYDFQRR
jgi:succinylarginine dihydrolase